MPSSKRLVEHHEPSSIETNRPSSTNCEIKTRVRSFTQYQDLKSNQEKRNMIVDIDTTVHISWTNYEGNYNYYEAIQYICAHTELDEEIAEAFLRDLQALGF